MRVLLDESLPPKLKGVLTGFEVRTVPEVGLSGVKNGALLRAVEGRFEVFVTPDKNLEYQQNLPRFSVAVVVSNTMRTDLKTLLLLVPELREVIAGAQPGRLYHVGAKVQPSANAPSSHTCTRALATSSFLKLLRQAVWLNARSRSVWGSIHSRPITAGGLS